MTTFQSTKWQNKLVSALDKANYDDTDQNWKAVGAPRGKLVASVFEYEIPNYDFMYGENERNYW